MAQLIRLFALTVSVVFLLQAVTAAPTYQIQSKVQGTHPLGVDPTQPLWQPIHLNADVNKWVMRPAGEPGVYRLSVLNSYPYIGVKDDKEVIATVEAEDDKEWRVNYWKEYDAFSIELNTGIWPTPAWTLNSDAPGTTVDLQLLVTFPKESQLWKITPSSE
ncbi:hypothetical protein CPB97_008314 [Podila verticillata]|nr:hypothetical protein CPB97_008314 [Podila verticillata]